MLATCSKHASNVFLAFHFHFTKFNAYKTFIQLCQAKIEVCPNKLYLSCLYRLVIIIGYTFLKQFDTQSTYISYLIHATRG